MIPAAIGSIGLMVLVQLLYTLAISAAIAMLIWYACRHERKPLLRGDA